MERDRRLEPREPKLHWGWSALGGVLGVALVVLIWNAVSGESESDEVPFEDVLRQRTTPSHPLTGDLRKAGDELSHQVRDALRHHRKTLETGDDSDIRALHVAASKASLTGAEVARIRAAAEALRDTPVGKIRIENSPKKTYAVVEAKGEDRVLVRLDRIDGKWLATTLWFAQ